MNAIIGRTAEAEKLNGIKSNKKSDLVAVYGRRRIGKTFLIRACFEKEIVFEITGLYRATTKDQIENFTNELNKRIGEPSSPKKIKNWLTAFKELGAYIDSLSSKKKKVIFIDEFPWMATSRSKFLMAFENFWNQYATRRADLIVVICGSAASYMVQKIIKNKGGLHNRISETIRLLPFNLQETGMYLRSRGVKYTNYDVAQLYMCIGGVPHYLEKIKKEESIAQNIDRLCFSKNGDLYNEFNQLYASLFDNSEKHLQLVKTLAKNLKGISRNELIEKSGLSSGGDTSLKLEELIQSGFVEDFTFYQNKKQLTLYRLIDEYSLFYLKYIVTNKKNGNGTWINLHKSQSFKAWCGYSFENICLKHIFCLKRALGIAGIYSNNNSWFNKNAQIDLLIDRDDNVMNVCEMKFYNSAYTITKQDYLNLKNKVNELQKETKTRKTIFITFITTFGIQQNEYSNELVRNSIVLDDLFKG